MPLISFFEKGIRQTRPTRHVEITEAIDLLRSKWKQEIMELRASDNPNVQDVLKQSLPYFTFSGTFNIRKIDGVVEHSGFLTLDFDHLHEKQEVDLRILERNLPYVAAAFTSCRGTGRKMLIRINGKHHAKCFNALSSFFAEKGFTVDASGKDVSRACFVTWDPELYHNPEATVFNPKGTDEKPSLKPKATPLAGDTADALAFAEKQVGTYSTGNRNNFIYHFACECNRLGIPEGEAFDFAIINFADVAEREIKASVNSGYKHHADEHGKKTRIRGKRAQPDEPQDPVLMEPMQADDFPHQILYESKITLIEQGVFWLRVTKKKTNEVTINIQVDHLIDFLQENGFFLQQITMPGQPDSFQMLRIKDNMIEPVHRGIVKQFIKKWADENKLPRIIRRKLITGSKTLFSSETFEFLKSSTLKFKRDTHDQAFLFFANCYVEITKSAVNIRQYTELDLPIWKHQIINRSFTHAEQFGDSEFFRFLQLAVTGKETFNAQSDEDVKLHNNLLSACTAIGYLLHGFKDPSKAHSINLFDAVMKNRKSADGRTGKSLLFKLLNYVKPVAFVECRAVQAQDLKKPETFSDVNFHTAVLLFNDVPPQFEYDLLFPFITEAIKVKRLYTDPISIPFDLGPKIAITANYTLKGKGDSYQGRQRNIELSNFFNAGHSPADYFKHNLGDWDEQQWNMFYSCIIHCIQLFLKEGVLPFTGKYALNKLLNEIPEEMYLFFEGLMLNYEYTKDVLIKSLEDEHDYTPKTPNYFTQCMREWADYKGYVINPHIHTMKESRFPHDKRGGMYYIKICEKKSLPEQAALPI